METFFYLLSSLFGGALQALSGASGILFVIALLVLSPLFFKSYGAALGAPGRIAAAVWNRLVRLFTITFLERRLAQLTPERVSRWLDERFHDSADPLMRGDRRAFAESNWSPKRWPTVYMDIPADVRRPVVWDGRLIGGHAVTWLGWRHISADVAAAMAREAGRVGLRTGAIATLLALAAVIWMLATRRMGGGVPYPEWASGVDIMVIANWYLLQGLNFGAQSLGAILLAVIGATLLIPFAAMTAFWRDMHGWWDSATAALRTPTRDSLVGWKHKSDIRASEYLAYVRQVQDAAGRLASQPIIPVGRAMGVLRARGDMESPTAGQLVAMDGEAIRQHVLVLGGTGSGKTRLVMRPLFKRIMGANWGREHRIGAYVTDGKGTLWQDLAPSISSRSDVVVVGTGDGQKGMDLLKGMSALEVSTTLRAVSGQVMGEASDSFWPESASLLVMHAAAVARVVDMDPMLDGADEWVDARPWSLVGVGRIATDWRVTEAVIGRLAELRDLPRDILGEDLYAALQDDDLLASVTWLTGTWYSLNNETKSSIIANVNVVLGKLAGAGELRRRFCTGRYDDVVDVDHALDGGVMMIAVGEQSWGMVGKVVAVWLKTRLFISARKRLQSDPAACKTTTCAMFADEWQMLVTTGPDSEATFTNIARESGVFLCVATQSLAALKQAIGDDATANLVNLLRTKIVLKTEEMSTLDYCVKLAGESLRGLVVDEGFYESQGQRELERPDVAPAPPVSAPLTFKRIMPSVPTLSTAPMRQAANLDRRFIRGASLASLFGKGGNGSAGGLEDERQAYWRQEDKEREIRANGLSWRPKLTTDELLMGSGLAFAVVQRAGCDRSDIIDLVEEA